MCLADLTTYPAADRLRIAREDAAILSSLAPASAPPSLVYGGASEATTCAGASPLLSAPPVDSGVPANSLDPSIVIRTRRGIPRVPSADDRLATWAAKFFGNGHHREIPLR